MTPTHTLDPAPLLLEAVTAHPRLATILRHLSVSLLVACVVPSALFYATLQNYGITAAVIVAVVWTYGAIIWRWATKRPMSGLLALTVTVMTIRTAFTLSTGNTFAYFLQPVVSDVVIAALFLASLLTARPVVARLAADFYPMHVEVAGRPGIRRLFWYLTLMWGVVCLARSALGFWLLESLSVADFVLVKTIALTTLTVLAVGVTVYASTVVLRRESMLAPA